MRRQASSTVKRCASGISRKEDGKEVKLGKLCPLLSVVGL